MKSHPGRFEHVTFASAVPALRRADSTAESKRVAGVIPPPTRPRGTPPAIEIPSRELDLLALVFRVAEIDLGCYRLQPLARRIQACLRALHASSPEHALEMLCRAPALVDTALDALLIGVSSFFRDAQVFAQLREAVIPELLATRRGIRVWSVGCSDGAELYSVAMILSDARALESSSLIGTDCRPSALLRARQGTFHIGTDPLPCGTRGHLVELRGRTARVAPAIRRAVRFKRSNALSETLPGRFDLILCRNLTIYLARGAADALWARLAGALAPHGYLVAGKAEQAPIAGLVRVSRSLYRREGNERHVA
jgi:chemotaxis protein methyltransferase CheR